MTWVQGRASKMPWEARGKKVYKKGTNELVGTHGSPEEAKAQVKALYANYHGPNTSDMSKAAKRRFAPKGQKTTGASY